MHANAFNTAASEFKKGVNYLQILGLLLPWRHFMCFWF